MAIMFSSRRQRSREKGNGLVKADFFKEVFVYMHLRDFFLSFNPIATTVGLHFTPACLLLSVCSLRILHSLHFTPGPQSEAFVLNLPICEVIFLYKQTFL